MIKGEIRGAWARKRDRHRHQDAMTCGCWKGETMALTSSA